MLDKSSSKSQAFFSIEPSSVVSIVGDNSKTVNLLPFAGTGEVIYSIGLLMGVLALDARL